MHHANKLLTSYKFPSSDIYIYKSQTLGSLESKLLPGFWSKSKVLWLFGILGTSRLLMWSQISRFPVQIRIMTGFVLYVVNRAPRTPKNSYVTALQFSISQHLAVVHFALQPDL